jgi:short-subunit dehydrogenase
LTAGLATFGATTEPVVVDLSQPASAREVQEVVAEHSVDVPVNDAGVCGHGRFATERQLATDLAMIQLNVTTACGTDRTAIARNAESPSGGILNVASIAGYLPGPGQAVYNANKAFVKSFSQAPSEETRNTGVRVTAPCPGPVATEFDSVAGYPPTTSLNPLMKVASPQRSPPQEAELGRR